MNLLFDSALDGRAWPHWPSRQKGMLGEIRVGELGLLEILETMLGLRAPTVPEGVRIASLVAFVNENKKAFWAKSAEVDPFGVARELLHLHDFLIMQGWQGQTLTPRLTDLSLLSDKIIPGVSQRFAAVLSGLDNYSGSLPDITLLESQDTMPLLVRKIFTKLQDLGAKCTVSGMPVSQWGSNDLGDAQNNRLVPKADGSLQFIRTDGVLQAAEDLAAWLAVTAKEEGLQDTVIIGSDAVLDNALHRFGLQTTGAAAESGNSLLQLLPLVLALGWTPPDPARIMELLSLPASPIPPGVGRRLMNALSKWPAMGSELWQENLGNGLAAIEDEERRERTRERLNVLFTPVAEDTYPVAEIIRRINMLSHWLRGRFRDDPASFPALNQCHIFLSMVEVIGLDSLGEPLLKKLLDEAFSAQPALPLLPAQAGLAVVPVPEAIVGPARRIIWWNFSRDTVSPIKTPLLSVEEQELLVDAGVLLPDTAMQADSRAARWRRPLDNAGQQLVLVCPQTDTAGEDLHPHPLWDELLAFSKDEANKLIAAKIQTTHLIPTRTLQPLSLPEPQHKWQVTEGGVQPRETESPSSLETFLGCPLKWSLQYNGKIRGGHSATLPNMVPVLGSLAHELVEEVLMQDVLPTPEEGAALAEKLFDRKAPQLVATLFQEGMEADRENIRNTVRQATAALLHHLHDAGVSEVKIEEKLSGIFGAQKLQGYADLVLDAPFTVIDLKRSWATFYKKKMESGTALQIILYGWLLKETRGRFPELAYYTLEDQTFLTTDPQRFSNAEEVKTPPASEVWEVFEKTFNDAWKILKSGLVFCPGNGDEVESRIEDEQLILEPPCRFCDYDVLCGRRFA